MGSMARMSAIDEGGGRTTVLRLVGEGKSLQFIADKLREDGVCDLTKQAVAHYVEGLESDPQMRDAIKLAAKRMREEAAELITGTAHTQLKAFRQLVTKLLEKLEPILVDFDANLTAAFPQRETESDGMYKARMYAVKALLENLPKLDARLEAWSKVLGSLEGAGVFDKGMSMGNSPPALTVNITNVTMQYQRILIDALSWLPTDKQALFRERIAAIEATP